MKINSGNYFNFLKLHTIFIIFLKKINAKQVLYQIEKKGLNLDNEKNIAKNK